MHEGVLCAVGLWESGQMGPSSHRPRRKLGQAATRSGSWIALQICPFRHRPISQQMQGYVTNIKKQKIGDMAIRRQSVHIHVDSTHPSLKSKGTAAPFWAH